MKQLKFLKNITFEGKAIWYKDCIYEVISEGANGQGREIYKLFCEDLKVRGIDTSLANNLYTVIEIQEEKKEEITEKINEEKKEDKVIEKNIVKEETKTESRPVKKQYNKSKQNYNKKKKSSK